MNVVDDTYLQSIHRDALRVLEELGVKCESLEVRRIFEGTGLAAYDEITGHIHVLSPLVEQALNTAPKRDQYWIPENAFGVGGTAPFVFDDQTGELVEAIMRNGSRFSQLTAKSLKMDL
jgi:trimethylamine--corrinoid protein Co-methyltransferase